MAQQHYSPSIFVSPMVQHQSSLAPNSNQPSVVHHQSYQAPVHHQQPQANFPQIDKGLAVPSFLPSDDPIASLSKAMAFISIAFASRYPPTNNQLKTSSNLRNQEIIQDGRVTIKTFKGDNLMVIMEYLVKIDNKDILKIIVLTTNTPYPSRKIRQLKQRYFEDYCSDNQYAVSIKEDTAKHFKTLSLDESRSLDFDLFSDQEEYSQGEVAETMAETMKQYMRKTRADNGSRISRPKIEDNYSFDLKGQFLKELRDNTFSSSDHEDVNEHIEKVLEIVDLFHILNITIDQVMLRTFHVSLIGVASCWLRNKPSGSITTWERFKELLMKCPQHYLTEIQEVVLFYNRLDVLTRQIFNSRGAIPSKTAADAKVAIQEMVEYSQKWHNRTSRTKRASISVMPLSTYLNLGLGDLDHTKLTVELADRTMKYPKGIAENVLVGIGKFVFPVDFIILDMPEDIKVPLILERLFLSTARAKIDVFKRKITLRAGEERIIFKSVKPASSLIKRVYMLSLRERMELDLEVRLIRETLVLNISLDPFFGDYIELNDLNILLELRRDQVDDLMPTIKEGEVIKEFRARNDARMVSKVFGYLSDCDRDKKIRIDCAYNLKVFLYDRIPPLLKVSKEDKMNRISYSYQKLKGFYKGVLNLGPEYVRDAKMEEWLTRGHISIHEME
nr:hypothetical protein [Tanacetum cinerariifolium]